MTEGQNPTERDHRVNHPPGSRYAAWSRRILAEQLGWGSELWEVREAHPAYREIEEIYRRLGRESDPSSITFVVVQNPLRDVAHAAGGIEYCFDRLTESEREAQRWTDEARAMFPRTDTDSPQREGVVPPNLPHLWYESFNLLIWTRMLLDRLEHRWQGHTFGLLPSLAESSLKDNVSRLHADLRARWASDAEVTNFVLHGSAIPYPGAGAEVLSDGRIHLPVPDHASQKVYNWNAFTWDKGRDAFTLTATVMLGVTGFMDALLDSFAAARRDRLTAAPLHPTSGSSTGP